MYAQFHLDAHWRENSRSTLVQDHADLVGADTNLARASQGHVSERLFHVVSGTHQTIDHELIVMTSLLVLEDAIRDPFKLRIPFQSEVVSQISQLHLPSEDLGSGVDTDSGQFDAGHGGQGGTTSDPNRAVSF